MVNAGPGLAIASAYFGVNGGRKFGAVFGKTNLLPNERASSQLPEGFVRGGSVDFIWFCRDADGRLLAWSYHGGHIELRPKRKKWPDSEELFAELYPRIVIPEGDILTFPVD